MTAVHAETVHRKAIEQAMIAARARKNEDEETASKGFEEAFRLEQRVVELVRDRPLDESVLQIYRSAASLALDCGNIAEFDAIIDGAITRNAPPQFLQELQNLRTRNDWPDSWLIASSRRDPPDRTALDELGNRYQPKAYAASLGRTMMQDSAEDLLNEGWRRLLNRRSSWKPGGNLPGLLMSAIRSAWVDRWRKSQHALAPGRTISLDASARADDEGETTRFEVADATSEKGRELTAQIVHELLGRLSPQHRDVLLQRYVENRSAEDIAASDGVTVGAVNARIRAAKNQFKELYIQRASGAQEPPV
ncbi:MAG TPA: RNA polymerase sigma factor [Bryobacteraceae bacterium]|nr:RNA polymerase sigma factor [Bryobacteraceae bacterium]